MELQATAARRFVDALAERDFHGMRACLSDDLKFRVLMPAGFREESRADAALEYFEEWFGGRAGYQMVLSELYAVADRIQGQYRIVATHEGELYELEQHFFANAGGATMDAVDLLCSGFRRM